MPVRQTRKESLQEGLVLPQLGELPIVAEESYVPVGFATEGHPFIEYVGRNILDVPNFETGCINALPIAPDGGLKLAHNPVMVALELKRILKGVYPTEYMVRLYMRLLEIVATGYLSRNPLRRSEAGRVAHMLQSTPMQVLMAIAEQTSSLDVPSLFVTGASGMGKSFGAEFILKLFPPPARHVSYRGAVMSDVQVPYLYVQCPPTGTLKALLFSILLQLDLTIGTDFYRKWFFSRESTDSLLVNVALIMYNYGTGALILDELQHLEPRGHAETEVMLNFFVSLMNFLRIPLISVGTYSALEFLTSVLRDSRRLSSAGSIDFARYREGSKMARGLEDYYLSFLPGQSQRPLTSDFKSKVYGIYQGFHFLLPNLVHRCSVEAAYRGLEFVTDEVLDYYYNVELLPIRPALDALRSKDPRRIALWDDLMSPEAIAALNKNQDRRDRERGYGLSEAPKHAAPSGPYFSMPEFPHEGFSPEEIANQCVISKTIFGKGDAYPMLAEAGLLARSAVHGRYESKTDEA